jgi:hypothetical protein
VAAAAEGKRDALFGVLGMMLGAAFFAELFKGLSGSLLKWGDLGPVTLPEATGIPAWVFFVVLTLAAVPLFVWLERREKS